MAVRNGSCKIGDDRQVQRAAREDEYLDDQILRLLECPVCEERMAPPMVQCAAGHALCAPCRAMAANCPLCYRAFTGSRDFLLEAVHRELVSLPCPHGERGCHFQGVSRELEEHAASCAHRDRPCPVTGCSWAGERAELRRHVARHHPRHLLEGDHHSAALRLDCEESCASELLEAHGELFLLSRSMCSARGATCFLVQLLGPAERCRHFAYELRLGSRGAAGPAATLLSPVREDTAPADQLLRECSCACVHTAWLGGLASHGVVRYELLVRELLLQP